VGGNQTNKNVASLHLEICDIGKSRLPVRNASKAITLLLIIHGYYLLALLPLPLTDILYSGLIWSAAAATFSITGWGRGIYPSSPEIF
jgi:hypothetical protein